MISCDRHVHVSLRDRQGRNIFAVTDEERQQGGRKNAANNDLKYVSQECEWFIGGVLDGVRDGVSFPPFMSQF